MRFAAIGLYVILLCPVYAQSQEPTPSAPEATKPEQEKAPADSKATQADQKKADNPPIVVNVLPAPKSDHETDEERKERKEKADLDRRLVDLTGDLAWFTAALFAATAGLVIATCALAYYAFKQSRDMKESLALTKRASDAAVATERSRFFIVLHENNIQRILEDFESRDRGSVLRFETSETPPRVKYSFRNYGKTPGIIGEISMGMLLSTEPPDPVFSVKLISFRENMIGGGGETETKDFLMDFPLHSSQAAGLKKREANLWFFGKVEYTDIFGDPQTHGFYFRVVLWDGEFILQSYDHKHYNRST